MTDAHAACLERREEEEYVIRRLQHIGLSAEKIGSTSARRTCDLLAAGNGARYLIEVKERRSDESIAAALRTNGSTGWRQHTMDFSASIDKTLRYAVKQLDAIQGGEDSFKLIWFCINPQYNDGPTLLRQVHDTVFGAANLVKMSRDGQADSIPCYFFHRNTFSTHPQLSAVVVDTRDAFTLLLNPYATRLPAFRETSLFRWFDAEPGGVLDAPALEIAGNVLVADCAVDRRDTFAVLTYLKRKYGLPPWGLVHLPMIRRFAYFKVPIEAVTE